MTVLSLEPNYAKTPGPAKASEDPLGSGSCGVRLHVIQSATPCHQFYIL